MEIFILWYYAPFPEFYPVGWAQCLLLLVSIMPCGIFDPDAHPSAQPREEGIDSLSQGYNPVILLPLLL